MRRQRLSRLHLLPLVSLTLLVLPPRVAWTQESPSASKTPPQWSSLAPPFVAVPEANFRLHPSLTGNYVLPEPWRLAKTDEPQAKANHFIGNAPTKWLTDVISHNRVNYRTPGPGGDVPYYTRPIPWAGRIILSIGQQAKFHPRVARVLEVINPGLGAGNPSPTGGPAGNTHVVGRGPFRN